MQRSKRSKRNAGIAGVLALILWTGVSAMQTPRPIVLPAGTSIAVRVLNDVDSQRAAPTAEYPASVDDSVTIDGATAIPTGAKAWLRAVSIQEAGAVNGRVTVSLRLAAVEINGKPITVLTRDATIQSNSQAANTAKKTVAGAAVGAALGALIGGVDGAVKGGTLGAGAGAVVAMATGPQVRIPKETRLSFSLTAEAAEGELPNQLSPDARAVFEQLYRLEVEGIAIAQRGDRAAADRLMHPQFEASVNGQAITRATFLARIRPQPEVLSSSIDELTFRLNGDRATLTGMAHSQLRIQGRTLNVTQRFTDVFVRQGETWLALRSDALY